MSAPIKTKRQSFVVSVLISLAAALAGTEGCRDSNSGPTPPSGPTGPTAAIGRTGSPGVGLTGSYSLTLIASASCATVTDWITHQAMPFPDSVRVRHYNAEFTGASGILTPTDSPSGQQIPIGGIDHYVYYGSSLLSVSNGVLQIIVPPDAADIAHRNDALLEGGPTCSGGDYWWESVSSTEVFDTCGTWRALMDDPARIAGTIDGAFGYYKGGGAGPGPNWMTRDLFCRATDHQFTLTKRQLIARHVTAFSKGST